MATNWHRYKVYKYESKKYTTVETSLQPISGDRKCASYQAVEKQHYSCPGNRDVDMTRNINYTNFLSGDVIDNRNINPFIGRMNDEIDQRKMNGLYNSYNETSDIISVHTGDTIREIQPNSISYLLTRLNDYILRINDYKITPTTDKVTSQNQIPEHPIKPGEICEAEDIKTLEKFINSQYNDCICYADCTNYYYYLTCNCYGDCGCDYTW